MKIALRRIIAPFILMSVLWLIVVFALESCIEALVGPFQSERMTPFNNAHLLEEAAEGNYSPAADPVFLVSTALTALIAFGVATLFAAWQASRGQAVLAAIPSVVGISILILPAMLGRGENYPLAMQHAAIIAFVAYAVASLASLFVGIRRPVKRMVNV